jgi:hypothetical protein
MASECRAARRPFRARETRRSGCRCTGVEASSSTATDARGNDPSEGDAGPDHSPPRWSEYVAVAARHFKEDIHQDLGGDLTRAQETILELAAQRWIVVQSLYQ